MAFGRRNGAWLLARALVVASLGVASSAQAHGGFWRANKILVDAAEPQRIVLQSALRGLVWSDDGGESFRWICAEAYGRSSVSAGAAVRMLPGEQTTLLTVSAQGGIHVSTDMCTFRELATPAGHAVRDAFRTGDRAVILAIPNDGETLANSLYAGSFPDGALERLGSPLPESLVGTSVWASEDLTRLWVAGVDDEGLAVGRTEDGGESWKVGAKIPFDVTRPFNLEIMEVSEERAYLFMNEQEWESGAMSRDALFMSEDGGETLLRVFADGSALHDLARSPDGATLVLSSARGLYRALAKDVVERGQEAFVRIRDEPVYGLRWVESGLYAGLEEFANEDRDAFGLGRSEDGGDSFAGVMSVCDVEQHVCAPTSTVGESCGEVFRDDDVGGGGFKEDFLDAPRCSVEAPSEPTPTLADAGAPDAAHDASSDAADPSRPAPPDEPREAARGPREAASAPRAGSKAEGCQSLSGSAASSARHRPALFLMLVWLVLRRRAARVRRVSREVK